MKRQYIFVLGLILIAGLANGVMDLVNFHFYLAPDWMDPQFWDVQISWKNKWVLAEDGKVTDLERFRWSSTFLVALTDGWHLMQKVMILAFCGAVSYGKKRWWLWFMLSFIVFSIGFNITYK